MKDQIRISITFDDRPSRHLICLTLCQVIALRGTCKRGKVGCVITVDGRVVTSGYNGPKGLKHCEELGCNLEEPCEHSYHAEANAIDFAIANKISLRGGTLYCTTAPCIGCAGLIVAKGIKRVVYKDDYRNNDGIDLLKTVGIETLKNAE